MTISFPHTSSPWTDASPSISFLLFLPCPSAFVGPFAFKSMQAGQGERPRRPFALPSSLAIVHAIHSTSFFLSPKAAMAATRGKPYPHYCGPRGKRASERGEAVFCSRKEGRKLGTFFKRAGRRRCGGGEKDTLSLSFSRLRPVFLSFVQQCRNRNARARSLPKHFDSCMVVLL